MPALFHHLLNVDMGDFLASSRAMMTRGKSNMLESSRSDLGTWVAALREDPDIVLRAAGHVIKHSLFSSQDLLDIYDPDKRGKVTANGLSRELARQQFIRAADGMGVRTLHGQLRLWHIRNVEDMVKLSAVELGNIYNNERGLKPIKGAR